MNRLPAEQQAILVVQAVILAALCARFLQTGLFKIYTWFFVYFVLALLQTPIPALVPIRSRLYLQVFMASEAAVVCCYALVVTEEYSTILREMSGIAKLARQYIQITLAVAALGGLLFVGMSRTPATPSQYFFACERAVIFFLLIFVLSSLIFLAYYPIPLSRNIIVYSIGFTIYLLSKAATLFALTLRMHMIRYINTVCVATSTVCLLFWLFALNRKGEAKKVLLVHQWNPEDERRILSRLQAINESLLRAGKK